MTAVAITRAVSPDMARCELTHLDRVPIDIEAARQQHREYEACLADLGCAVRQLPAGDGMPDSVFIEDAALVLDELAIITRPGAASRRGECVAAAEALREYRDVREIRAPGTLDGGDVLRLGRRLFVGASGRSNAAGIDHLRALVTPLGYAVIAVPLRGCLHLKSAVTAVGDGLLVANRAWVDPAVFGEVEVIDVDPAEPFAANILAVNGVAVLSAAHPRTRERLEARGLRTRAVDVTEVAKAEGGVTCCCLLVSGSF